MGPDGARQGILSPMKMNLQSALAAGLLGMTCGVSWAQESAPPLYQEGGAVALAWAGERLALAVASGVSVADFSKDAGAQDFAPLFQPAAGVAPVLAGNGDFLAGASASGEVVVWDLVARRELGRRAGGAGPPRILALAPGGMQFFVGDGKAGLFSVSLDSPLPAQVGYPGPGELAALGFDSLGLLRALPSRWSWVPSTGVWQQADGLDFQAREGRNKLALAAGEDLVAMYRSERPTLLKTGTGELVDLGYREAMDLVLDAERGRALVSFPGAGGETGYGAGEVSDEALLGSLESFDAKTGERLAVLPRKGVALSPSEALDHRTFGLGLRMADLGDGRLATVDFVDHKGEPSLFLRIRGADLVATGELPLDTGAWPLHLAVGGGLMAVAYEETAVDVYDIKALADGAEPLMSLPIAAQTDPMGAEVAPPRDVFALSRDGNNLAMCGPGGTVYFVNPRTGWPNGTVSVNLPLGAGRPRAARFEANGGLTMVTEDLDEKGQAAGLFERTLDSTGTRWSEPTAVDAVGRVSGDGKLRVELRHGVPGNLDVYRGAIEGGSLIGKLIWRAPSGSEPVDALAISSTGRIAWAQAGRVHHVKVIDDAPDAPR